MRVEPSLPFLDLGASAAGGVLLDMRLHEGRPRPACGQAEAAGWRPMASVLHADHLLCSVRVSPVLPGPRVRVWLRIPAPLALAHGGDSLFALPLSIFCLFFNLFSI